MLLRDLKDLVGVAARRAAAQVGDPQVAGVHEADELRRFVVQQRVRPDRVARASPGVGEPRPDVGRLLVAGRRVAAVAIDAAEPDSLGLAVRLVLSLVAGEAARTLGGGRLGGLPREVESAQLWRDRETARTRAWPGGRPHARGGLDGGVWALAS